MHIRQGLILLLLVLFSSCTGSSRQETKTPEEAASDTLTLTEKKANASRIVYITKEGDKYHTADCRYAEGARAVKLVSAKAMKKKACDVCKPLSAKDQKQCTGTTAEGKQCQRMTANASGRCYQHQPQ